MVQSYSIPLDQIRLSKLTLRNGKFDPRILLDCPNLTELKITGEKIEIDQNG